MVRTLAPIRHIFSCLLVTTVLIAGCGHASHPAPRTKAAPTTPRQGGDPPTNLDPAHVALLVLDLQQGIASMAGPAADAAIAHTSDAEQTARNAGALVVFVGTAFQPGYPEISPRNKVFAKTRDQPTDLTGPIQFDPRIAPQDNEPVVTKHRVGAFGPTSLEQILRARNIDTVVLAGIATSGAVLSTLRSAADLDYRIDVLSDCVAEPDPEVQKVLLEKVFPVQADVIDTAAFAAALHG